MLNKILVMVLAPVGRGLGFGNFDGNEVWKNLVKRLDNDKPIKALRLEMSW